MPSGGVRECRMLGMLEASLERDPRRAIRHVHAFRGALCARCPGRRRLSSPGAALRPARVLGRETSLTPRAVRTSWTALPRGRPGSRSCSEGRRSCWAARWRA
eukprot:6233578-Prymnesium_polylepis.2